jgi:hypothetical protein
MYSKYQTKLLRFHCNFQSFANSFEEFNVMGILQIFLCIQHKNKNFKRRFGAFIAIEIILQCLGRTDS